MNRKMWFYSTAMSLLMLTATYIAFNADGGTWEDFKGGFEDCLDSRVAPSNATTPDSCTFFLGCPDVTTHGTHGHCITTHAWTNRKGLGTYWASGYIKSQTRDCELRKVWGIPVPPCIDNGVTPVTGDLLDCTLTTC